MQGESGTAADVAGARGGEGLDASAFRAIYPRQFYERFLAEGLRPDGRPLGRARPTSVALGAVSTANGSAHVKVKTNAEPSAVPLAHRHCHSQRARPQAVVDGRLLGFAIGAGRRDRRTSRCQTRDRQPEVGEA
eukprot:scaffold1122_cov377-Prasinococcus_capsulatus_cf.AAC.5